MPDGLYERDVLVWSEQQAALLRRLAQGERVNEEIDWPNIIEEVGDLGLSELNACQSWLRQALVHLVKIANGPPQPSEHWRDEVAAFLADAQARFTPSMRQRVDVEKIYRRACRQLQRGRSKNDAPLRFPENCPVTLDDLLSDQIDLTSLEQKFAV